jgi:hypothetical protein
MNEIQSKFNQLAHISGINNEDLRAVANMFFHLGVSIALNEQPEKLCKLVSTNQNMINMMGNTFCGVQSVTALQDTLDNSKRSNVLFSNSELQFLSYMLREILNEMETSKETCKRAIDYYWINSNPDNPSSLDLYKKLNQVKDVKRDLKAKANKMASIQRKIKHQVRGN